MLQADKNKKDHLSCFNVGYIQMGPQILYIHVLSRFLNYAALNIKSNKPKKSVVKMGQKMGVKKIKRRYASI